MSSNRQQNRADVRRVLRFVRTMNRLKEAWGSAEPRIKVKMAMTTAGPKIVEGPAWTEVENLLSRFRSIYLDRENCSFKKIIRILPRHTSVAPSKPDPEFQGFEDLESRWDALLDGTTAPLPAGSTVGGLGIPAGFVAESQEEGLLEIGFQGNKLTGREAIDLSIYGVLVHVDQAKERKRLQIQKTFIEPGYRVAVMAVFAGLVKAADQLRIYAEGFIEELRKIHGQEKLDEIEAEVDAPPPAAGSGGLVAR